MTFHTTFDNSVLICYNKLLDSFVTILHIRKSSQVCYTSRGLERLGHFIQHIVGQFVMITKRRRRWERLGQLLMAESAFSGDWKATFVGHLSPPQLRPGPLFFGLKPLFVGSLSHFFCLWYCTSRSCTIVHQVRLG